MGRDLHYRPGSFYRTDDRTGFPTRAEKTKKEWNGLIVSEDVWEARQPQDLVRGVPDIQSVPDARPLAPNTFVGPISVSLTVAAGPGVATLSVDSTAGFAAGAPVSVMLDSGVGYRATIAAPPGPTTLQLSHGLPGSAAVGNLVTLNESNIPDPPEP